MNAQQTERAPVTCEGCRGFGGNWNCEGENDPDDCNCASCTGNEDCPECDGHGHYPV